MTAGHLCLGVWWAAQTLRFLQLALFGGPSRLGSGPSGLLLSQAHPWSHLLCCSPYILHREIPLAPPSTTTQNPATPHPSAAATLVSAAIASCWDWCRHLLPGPLCHCPLTGGSPPCVSHVTFPLCSEPSHGSYLTQYKSHSSEDDLDGPSVSGLSTSHVYLSDLISKHTLHSPAPGPLHLLSAWSRAFLRCPCSLLPL